MLLVWSLKRRMYKRNASQSTSRSHLSWRNRSDIIGSTFSTLIINVESRSLSCFQGISENGWIKIFIIPARETSYSIRSLAIWHIIKLRFRCAPVCLDCVKSGVLPARYEVMMFSFKKKMRLAGKWYESTQSRRKWKMHHSMYVLTR